MSPSPSQVAPRRVSAPWARWVTVLTVLAAFGLGCGSSSSAEPKPIDAPKPSSDGAVAAYGQHIYWIAGTTGRPDDLVRRFDTTTGKWEQIAAVTQARLHLAAATVGDRIVAVGGMADVGRHSDVVEIYETAKHAWTRTGKLPKAVSAPAAAAIGDVVYVFGGDEVLDPSLQSYDAASVATSAAIRDGGKTVAEIAPMPTAREEACAVAVGDRVYVLGGRMSKSGEDTAFPPATSAVEIYDPAKNAWTAGPEMPRSAVGYAALLGDELVFFGGEPLSTAEPMILEVASGVWRTGKPRDTKTVGDTVEGAVVIDGKLLVVTQVLRGLTEPSIPHVFGYDPRADSWTKVY